MSDEPLTQNQAESLLEKMGIHSSTGANQSAPPAASSENQHVPDKVVEYDFRQPSQVRREQMHALHAMHHVVAKQFAESASVLMRTAVDVKLLAVEQNSFNEFVYSLDDPSCFCVITPQPLPGRWMINIAPGLMFALIDRMLGGEPNPGETICRRMTDIEVRLIRRVVDNFLNQLRQSWSTVVALDLSIETVEDHPHHSQLFSVNDQVIRIDMEISLCNVRGILTCCLPISTIEHLGHELLPERWDDRQQHAPTAQTRQTVADNLASASIDVVVNVARSTIRTDDLLGLSVGDIIATEKEISEPLELAIQNVPKFQARAGAYKGKKAVQIESILEKPTEDRHSVERIIRKESKSDD